MEAESAESPRVLRGAGNSAEGVRQLAGEVQGTGADAAVSAWEPKSSLSPGLSQGLVMTCALLSHLRARVVVGSSAKRINGKYWRKRLLPGARFAEVARRYGIAERVLFRWKQELTVTAPAFVSVEIGAIEIDRRRRVWSVPTPIEHRSLHESASLNF